MPLFFDIVFHMPLLNICSYFKVLTTSFKLTDFSVKKKRRKINGHHLKGHGKNYV